MKANFIVLAKIGGSNVPRGYGNYQSRGKAMAAGDRLKRANPAWEVWVEPRWNNEYAKWSG